MPRQRMIKPDFFESGSLAECSRDARLTFVGLWVMADDKGNMKFEERKLVRQLFPYDDLDPRMLIVWLAELEDVGCIKTYEAHGDVCVSIPNFPIYQTVKNPSKSTVPAPPEGLREGPRTDYFTGAARTLWGVANPHFPPDFLPVVDCGKHSRKDRSSIIPGDGLTHSFPTVADCGKRASDCGKTNGEAMGGYATGPGLTPEVPPSKERSKEDFSSSPLGEEEEKSPVDTGSDGGICPECGSAEVEPRGARLMACSSCGSVWEVRPC